MRGTIVAVVALAIAGVGCSGGDDDDASDATSRNTEAPRATAPAETEATHIPSSTTVPASTTTTTSPSTSTSSSTTSSSTTSTTAAPSTTLAATTTTVDPIVAAGIYYTDAATMINCGSQILFMVENDVLGADALWYPEDWPEIQQRLQPVYKSFADDSIRFVEALVAYPWPEAVQADIDALVNEVSAQAAAFQAFASATTFDTFVSTPAAPPPNAASVVRAKLGLPSNINTSIDACVGALAPTTTTA